MRKSFILHHDSLSILDDLTDEQCGKLFRAIKSYHLGEELELEPIIKIAFSPLKNQFIRDNEKYQNVVERNKLNGSKGGRPKNPKEPTGLSGNPNKPKKADNDNDSKNDNDSNNKSKEKKTSRFAPPTHQDVGNYFLERGSTNAVNESDKFIDFYSSKDWMIGKNKMKDWKAAVRNWMRKSNYNNPNDNNQKAQLKSIPSRVADTSWADGLTLSNGSVFDSSRRE